MDHAVAGKGPRRATVDQYFPYPSHKVGYQGFRAAFDTQIPRLPAQVRRGTNRIPEHLLTWHDKPICRQGRAKV